MCIKNFYIKETVYCTVQCTLVGLHVYVHIKKLSLRAAVVAYRSITASMLGVSYQISRFVAS